MKPLHIDFAAPSARRTLFLVHPALLAAAVLGLLLCLSAAFAAYRWEGLRQAQAAQAAQVRQSEQRRRDRVAVAVAPAPMAHVSKAQAAAVNGAVLRLNLPWNALQEALGAATPRNVALLALEPDARKGILRINAEARNSEAMFVYLGALQGQALFRSVQLTHHEISEDDAGQPVRFQIEAQWVAP